MEFVFSLMFAERAAPRLAGTAITLSHSFFNYISCLPMTTAKIIKK